MLEGVGDDGVAEAGRVAGNPALAGGAGFGDGWGDFGGADFGGAGFGGWGLLLLTVFDGLGARFDGFAATFFAGFGGFDGFAFTDFAGFADFFFAA